MKVIVTGGAGYIGSMLVPMLLAAGHHVRVIDSFRYGNETTLAASCHWTNFSMEREDVRSYAGYSWADVVIPLAAIVGAPACDRSPNDAASINHGAVEMMLRGLGPGQMVIYPNTNSGYGSNPGVCTEETPLNPLSIYAQTKRYGEQAVLNHGGVSLRLATVFGMSPRMRLDLMVNDFVYRAVRDRSIVLYEPNHRRNFIHVRDVARAFMFALDRYDYMAGSVFNVGQDKANMTKAELCQRIQRFLPDFYWTANGGGADPDQRDYEVSSARIHALNYQPLYDIDDGIRELITGLRVLPSTILGNV